jgi:hypothetical protein
MIALLPLGSSPQRRDPTLLVGSPVLLPETKLPVPTQGQYELWGSKSLTHLLGPLQVYFVTDGEAPALPQLLKRHQAAGNQARARFIMKSPA